MFHCRSRLSERDSQRVHCRSIDVPALQDELDRVGCAVGVFLSKNPGTPSDHGRLCRASALKKDVDFLPMVKPDAINYSEIRRD